MSTKITADRLRLLLSYDKITGHFQWRADKFNTRGQLVARAGRIAGGVNAVGYWQMRIDGQLYLGHRLAWLYVHGEWPLPQIDHANCNRSDNRIANLRLATISEQRGNQKRRKDNSTGLKGVCRHKSGLLMVSCKRKGMPTYTSYFRSEAEAARAYAEASKRMYGEFARAE